MKNQLIFILLFTFTNVVFAQQDDNKQLCRVNKIQGKEVYVMCEPIADYEVIDKVNSAVAQMLGVSPTLNNMINTLVDKSVTKETKAKVKPFDAIITTDGNNAILIKFKEIKKEEKSIGRITKQLGKEVYVMCEPIRDYDVVDKVNSAFAQVIGVSPTVENMVKLMVEKAVNKESKGTIGKFDAVITSDGDNAILIKFKE